MIRQDGRDNGVQALAGGAGTPSPLPGGAAVADPETLATLDFAAALDLVAGHAAGPLGAACLCARRPTADLAVIRADLALAAEALGLLEAGDGLEVAPVPDIAGPLARLRIEGSVLDGAELVPIMTTLAAARTVARELRRVREQAPGLAALEVPLPGRAVEQRLARSLDPTGEVLDDASPALAAARREVQVARDRLIRKLEAILRGLDPQAATAGGGVTVRGGRYVIPVRRDSRARPAGIVHDESATAGTLFVEPTGAIDLGNALREADVAVSREVLRVLRELTELLRPDRDTVAAAHAMCVLADDAAARGRYARAARAVVPRVLPPGGALTIRQGRHPLLLAKAGPTVPFDLTLEPGERILLVSGPNAGGKTVLLKSVGLFAALVQSGVIPPVGPDSAFPVVARIRADIGDHQSLAADLSTFSAHLAFLRQTLLEASGGMLVLLDELGGGTDPAEGAALGWSVLEALAGRGALTLATTHSGALKTLASEIPGVVHGSLEFDGATLSPSYRFRKGVPGRSWGLAIARRLGVPSDVVARAETHVPEGERALDALLQEVQQRDTALREREALLADLLEDATRKAAELEGRLQAVEARERELRRRERDLEQQAARQVRAYLLEARKQVEAALVAAAAARTVEEARAARRLVEEALADTRLEAAGEPAASGLLIDGPVRPGARVRLATGGTGRVEEVRDDGRLVVLAGNVRLVVPVSALAGTAPGPGGKRGP